MQSFERATDWPLHSPGSWSAEIDPSWQQGRAAYGGLLAGAALRGMRSLVEPQRQPRSLQVLFVAPAGAGPLTLCASLLRAGRSMSLTQARIVQGERLIATVSGSFSADRASKIAVTPPHAPDATPPEQAMVQPYIPGFTPAFTQHLDYRWVGSALPFSGQPAPPPGTLPVTLGYCRFKSPVSDPALHIVGLADAWPAPTLTQARGPVPASTVSWNLQLLQLPEADPQGWWTMRYQAEQAYGGAATVTGHLYAPGGALAALSTQLVVVFDQR